ncbi:GGDEF domain-containing protein [Alteromonas lipolytica]|uniref:diguanylate cyclase n=1 Tax=Alteromonas lipolytica TaxID=1856405 RepID=A0A1E8FC11_9ALTE|nr:diguanylate cyclase [Alteromonas lipolytica]OFI33464.1 diguanylate cyclase response regulator [Alteromonas lipolytica]GGF59454.1 diguanylate cyclase response regulator [Alteromonas lipolytica]
MQQKVLIIEDSVSSISLLKKLVEMAQLEPVLATTLTAAKHLFMHSEPEDYLCAIVDYDLPDAIHGEAIDFAVQSYLPTIVTTARLDEDIRKSVLSRDVVDYIPKENAQMFDYLMRLLGRLEKNKTIGVLVINTKRAERNAIAALLRRHNFITYECATAADAETILDKHSHIKLVFVDSEIQDKPATLFISWLRKQYAKEDLAIIGLASDRNNLLSARFIKSGANDFVRKPYHLEEFLCRVNQNIELIENVETIRRTANTDYLTGLPNRRHFFYTVNKMQRNQPAQQALALLDLDFFKSINDTHGHDAGDEVLRVVAKRLGVICSDVIIARFGGEEFCVYLPDFTPEEAIQRLQHICRKIAEKPVLFEQTSIPVTVSIGLTTQNDHNIQSMLTTADKLLYQAKHNGRNRVVHD